MLVTVVGMVTLVMDIPLKASFPMATTVCPSMLLGMETAERAPL